MTACFYDKRGWMVGIDKHRFWERNPIPYIGIAIGTPKNDHYHLVGAPHWWLNNAKHTTNVTSDGNLMLQKDHSMEYIPHIPWAFWKISILGGVWLAGVIVMSESKPFLVKGDVHGNGAPLGVCFYSCIGGNLNCGGYGLVINPNSVVTTPTLSDYLDAIIPMIIGKIFDFIVDKIVPKGPNVIPWAENEKEEFFPVKEAIEKAIDKFVKPHVVDPASDFVRSKVKQYAGV